MVFYFAYLLVCDSYKLIYLKGYTTPKSRSWFCLHFWPKDDVVVSILVQGRSLLGSRILLFVCFLRGNAPFLIQRVISLVQESNQQQNTGLFCAPFRLVQSLVEGFRGIFESTSWGEKASNYPRKQIEQKNHWVNIRGCISL